jgi:hypothetical protein
MIHCRHTITQCHSRYDQAVILAKLPHAHASFVTYTDVQSLRLSIRANDQATPANAKHEDAAADTDHFDLQTALPDTSPAADSMLGQLAKQAAQT